MSIYLSVSSARVGSPESHFVGAQNYTRLFADPVLWQTVRNSFVFTLGSEAIRLVIGLPLAFALNRSFKGKRIVQGIILIPFVIPIALSSLAWKWMFDSLYSVINWMLMRAHIIEYPWQWLCEPGLAMWSGIIMNVWRGFPFSAVILLAGLTAVPQEVIEAAKIDGAGPLRRFHYVVVHIVRPILLVGLLYSVVFSFTDFSAVWLLTQGGPYNTTHVFGTYAYNIGINAGDLGMGAAITLFIFPFLALIVILMLRFWRKAGGHGRPTLLATAQARLRPLPPALPVPVRGALPVLLDGHHRLQARPGSLQPGDRAVLVQGAAHPRARQAPARGHPVPALAKEQPDARRPRAVHHPPPRAARRLRGDPDEVPRGPAAVHRHVSLLPDPVHPAVHPAVAGGARSRVHRLGVGAGHRLSLLHPAVLHLALDGLRADGAEGDRGERTDRRMHALPGLPHDYRPGHRARHHHRRHLRVHAHLPGVHLRADLHLELGEQDDLLRGHQRSHPRRRLLLGLAHGGSADRGDPGGRRVRVQPRPFHSRPHRRCPEVIRELSPGG